MVPQTEEDTVIAEPIRHAMSSTYGRLTSTPQVRSTFSSQLTKEEVLILLFPAYTTHPCDGTGCDLDGCQINPYRTNQSFYGNLFSLFYYFFSIFFYCVLLAI